jgi:hypothetical protein
MLVDRVLTAGRELAGGVGILSQAGGVACRNRYGNLDRIPPATATHPTLESDPNIGLPRSLIHETHAPLGGTSPRLRCHRMNSDWRVGVASIEYLC